jgi:hypothetical protein
MEDQETRVKELSLELLINPDLARARVNRRGVSHRVFTYDDVVGEPYDNFSGIDFEGKLLRGYCQRPIRSRSA